MKTPIIEVYVTRKGKFIVEVTAPIKGKLRGVKTVQITIGDNRWKAGEIDEYKDIIYRKVRELITSLHIQCEEHIANE